MTLITRYFSSKINQSSAVRPVVVSQTTSLAASARPIRKVNRKRGRGTARQSSRRRKSKRGKGRRKKKGRKRRKKKKGRRRGHRRRHSPDGSRNSTRSKGKRKRKNPHLPFRVPTAPPPSTVNATSDRPRGAGATNSSEGDGVRHTLPGDEEEGVEELSSSSEMSLPKYLRHRGRRQLGEGGGIIQAPLLSACKPGAKRDYNYKCRPKFIPQGRDRRRVAGVSVGPRRPTISCPKVSRVQVRFLVKPVLELLH